MREDNTLTFPNRGTNAGSNKFASKGVLNNYWRRSSRQAWSGSGEKQLFFNSSWAVFLSSGFKTPTKCLCLLFYLTGKCVRTFDTAPCSISFCLRWASWKLLSAVAKSLMSRSLSNLQFLWNKNVTFVMPTVIKWTVSKARRYLGDQIPLSSLKFQFTKNHFSSWPPDVSLSFNAIYEKYKKKFDQPWTFLSDEFQRLFKFIGNWKFQRKQFLQIFFFFFF